MNNTSAASGSVSYYLQVIIVVMLVIISGGCLYIDTSLPYPREAKVAKTCVQAQSVVARRHEIYVFGI